MLKNLVWKETKKDEKIDKLFTKHSNIWTEAEKNKSRAKFMFDNAEQIAKEKQEILNNSVYTMNDVEEMFREAGFKTKRNEELVFTYLTNNKHAELRLILRDCFCYFEFETLGNYNAQSVTISYNDRKSIEFYYNTFRNILEFEVNVRD